jgi:hypothetical protein
LHSLAGGTKKAEAATIASHALGILEQYIHKAPDQWYQWKEVRTLFGPEIFQEPDEIYALEEDHSLAVADSAANI